MSFCCGSALQNPFPDLRVGRRVLDHTSGVDPPQPEVWSIRLRAKRELVGFPKVRVMGRFLRQSQKRLSKGVVRVQVTAVRSSVIVVFIATHGDDDEGDHDDDDHHDHDDNDD